MYRHRKRIGIFMLCFYMVYSLMTPHISMNCIEILAKPTATPKATKKPKDDSKDTKATDAPKATDGGTTNSGSVSIQDGKPMSDVYSKNTTIPSSFNVGYYDCAVPYSLTHKELGGYNTQGYNYKGYHAPVSESKTMLAYKVGTKLNIENSAGSGTLATCAKKSGVAGNWKTDDKTKVEYVEKNGIKFYICAIPMFFWKGERDKKPASGFPTFNTSSGQMFDVIMTDGTVIHFIVGDCIGADHTLKGTSGGQDGVTFKFADWGKPEYKVYRYLTHADNLQILELWCDPSAGAIDKFGTKYKFDSISGKKNNNKIAYLRMYKTKWTSDKWKVNSGVPEGFDYKLDGVSITEGVENTSTTGTTSSGGGSLMAESHFIATERPLHEKEVKLADGSDLTYDEKKNLEMLKDANDKSFLTEAISLLRAIIMLIGIIMTVYCIFFYLIYWFDRVNSLMDFSLLKVISFGKVQTSMDDESSYGTDIEGTKEVNHGDVLRICIIGLMLGMFLATGRIFKVVSFIQGIVDWFLTAVLG